LTSYFLVTFLNGDYKIGRIMPCTQPGKIRIGRSVYSTDEIEMIEKIPIDIVEEIYELVHDLKTSEDNMRRKVKEILMINKRPSYVFAFYSDDWGYDIYVGYIENSLG